FKSHPVTLIFGENGTGKSTVADAFGFVCNKEESGALAGYSITSPSKYVPSLGKPASAINVELVAGSKRWTASSGASGITVTPSDVPDAQILRRRTVLRLIEGKPKDRYEALKELIDVPRIEHAEAAVRAAYKAANDELTQATGALAQATAALDSLWTAEGNPGSSAIAWAQTEASKDQATLKAYVADSDGLERQYSDAASASATFSQSSVDLAEATASRTEAESRRKVLEGTGGGQSAELLRLLEDSRAYVAQHTDVEVCPVCEQSIDAPKLSERLLVRIDQMQSLGEATAALEEADRSLSEKATAASVRRRDFVLAVRALGLSLRDSSLPPVLAVKQQMQQFQDFLASTECTEKEGAEASSLWTAVESTRADLNSQASANRRSITLHGSISTQLATVLEMSSKAKELEALSKRVKDLLDIVSKRRKAHIDDVLQRIGADVERLYSQLHPGESLGGVRFFLKPTAIGSLEFDATFYGATKVPPQAYYSESHLDTLGVCVFLARAKLFKTEHTIVILDDVLTSVDGAHLQRFMGMLHGEAPHFSRVIVLTHYRPWRDQYRWAKGPAANTQVIELGPWTLTNGVNAYDFVTDLDALKNALSRSPFDRQIVASKAGIAAESLLDFLTLKYRCKISRNARGEYTLGELAGGLDSKLSSALRVRIQSASGPKEVALKSLIDAATQYAWVRNSVGCHFSVSGANVTDAEVLGFAKAVVALADALVCGKCRTLPTRRPSGTDWQCQCAKDGLHLEPLVAPGMDPAFVDDES
ncbi:MAG TPA: AAA family ATPase, partial [Fimbriimonas sp.]|nr:AAA family ATPase [Fimbriimonas sp.]